METTKERKAALLGIRPFCLAVFHLVLILPAFGQAKFFTTTNNGAITIKGYQGFTDIRSYKPRSEVLTIPDTINGLPVVSIGDHAFYDHGLISVTIPKSITSIGSSAFQSCASLTNVEIPDSVTNIGFGAFSGCHDLRTITIPQGVTNIGQVAFSSCVNLESINVAVLNPVYTSVDGVLLNKSKTRLIECPGAKAGAYAVPDGVTLISDNAFTALTRLTSVTLPNSVTNIEWHAFASCRALTNVTIGSGVTSIGDDSGWLTFNGCQKLTTIAVDALNPVFSGVDGVLINKSRATLIKFPEGKTGAFVVPNSVTTIGSHAFSSSTDLTSITLPDSVNSIEDSAFEGCVGLASVTFGNNLKNIGLSAFHSCTNLTAIKIPNSVTNIAEGAFYSCLSLTNVVIGNKAIHIGKTAFASCNPSIAITVDSSNPEYGSKSGVLVKKHPVVPLAIIKEPANSALINAMWIDVHGTLAAKNLKKVTVNQMPALVNGNTFRVLNVFLEPGTNTITAIAEDLAGNTGTNSITVTGPTDTNTARIFPVQLQITPSGGFVPLSVTLNVQAHVPGKIQKVFYDFGLGNNTPDRINSDLRPVSHTYKDSGEYYPVVTVQTSVGQFSSIGPGFWFFGGTRVTVQKPPVLMSVIKIADPIDLKWTTTSNLYVLSGSAATITEFDSTGNSIRSLKNIGGKPSGFDVDDSGNVYVALSASNQVWKFKPITNSFEVDGSFGSGGYIGNKDGASGAKSNELSAPFDVAVAHDFEKQLILVADSGNHRIERFNQDGQFSSSGFQVGKDGAFISSYGERGTNQSQFDNPQGLAVDELRQNLFITDSGNNRVVVADYSGPRATSGEAGSLLGQFRGPINVSVSERGICVADLGNNRIQLFDSVRGGEGGALAPFKPRFSVSSEFGLKGPKAAVWSKDFLEEKLYIADTGNNRVILVKFPASKPDEVWNALIEYLRKGDSEGAISCFSNLSKDKYREAFLGLTKDELRSMVKDMDKIKPATIENDHAQYYFESVVDGNTITFPVEFDKEFGQWKILEY